MGSGYYFKSGLREEKFATVDSAPSDLEKKVAILKKVITYISKNLSNVECAFKAPKQLCADSPFLVKFSHTAKCAIFKFSNETI